MNSNAQMGTNNWQSGLQFKAQIVIRDGDPILPYIQRATKIGERPGMGLRRLLTRATQLLDGTQPPPADIIGILHTVTASRKNFLHGLSYPPREVVARAVGESTINPEERARFLSYLDRISFADYARLIEAVETL